MSALSRWIVAYAVLLFLPQLSDLLHLTLSPLCTGIERINWFGGALIMAAGIAAAQRRRLFRVGGTVAAMFVALALTGVYSWKSAEVWRLHPAPLPRGATLSGLALASIGLVWLIIRLRPHEGIASRGYAVTFANPRRRGDPAFLTPQDRS